MTPTALPAALPEPARESLRPLWHSPLPLVLLDEWLVVLGANAAALALTDRSALAGLDWSTVAELPDPDPARSVWRDAVQAPAGAAIEPCRVRGDCGRIVQCRVTVAPLASGRHRLLVLHEIAAADALRGADAYAQAEHAQAEMAQWFALESVGMVAFDSHGLVLRCNARFESLVGEAPVALGQAGEALRLLLGWEDGPPALAPGAPAAERHVSVRSSDGSRRHLWSRVVAWQTPVGQARYLAAVGDRSAEVERDLARLEMGALMDAASVGVATYDPAHGWLHGPGPRSDSPVQASALQGIGRDVVEPESLPAYERLQEALRSGERAEVRYAVRHPELGLRWLLTRVEPGGASGSGRASSVVTVDVSEQERARSRSDALARELQAILDGATAGVALLRGGVVARGNRRLERMLGLEPGAAAGATLAEAFAGDTRAAALAADAAAALDAGTEFAGEAPFGQRWLALSLTAPGTGGEAVAVLTDVTRLKSQQAELEALMRERELMFSVAEVGIVQQQGASIARANQAMVELTGRSAAELTMLDVAELYPGARECADFEATMAADLRAEGRFVGVRRLRRRDGSTIWVQVAARLIDPADPAAGVVCSFVDVDERHRAREMLVQQAVRTRAMLDQVLVGIVTVADGRIDWLNRSARRMFGGELADFVGEAISIVATPESDHPLRRADYLRRLGEGQAEIFECRLRARDGREFWVVGNVVVTPGEGAPPHLTFALLDIDARRRAEVNVAQARSSLQRVIETAPLAIALLDGATRQVQQANPAAAAFLAAPPAGLELALEEAANPGTMPVRLELRQHRGDSGFPSRVWDTRIVALTDSAGAPPQLLVLASDVTEQRAADQARLQAAIEQRELLVKEVHHRIKNNLQGVAGLLQQYAARRPEVAEPLAEATGQVQAIAQVYGLQVGAGGPLRLWRVIEAIGLSVQRSFGRTIGCGCDDDAQALTLPEVESIPIALAINELLTNAVKHGAGDPVRCELSADGEGGALIELRNPGRLPADLDVARVPGGVAGLGLVRSLLPRRHATLALQQDGDQVLTRLVLGPAVLRSRATMVSGMVEQDAA